MRADLIVPGKSLTGSSDLTLLAPLKAGLVPSLETLTYKTRTQRLLKLLTGGRASAHEFALQRPISDAIERVARIHSVRVAVLEPEDKVLLAVTFDGTWEAYIRVLWQKVGSLLDIIFCNTEHYVLSTEGFEAWTGWVRRVQVESGFFFNTHGLTVEDVDYLRTAEARQRAAINPAQGSLDTLRVRVSSAEDKAYAVGQTTTTGAVDALRQGMQSLALLFRLTDLYLPDTEDGDVLVRAARDLLLEFCPLVEDPDLFPEVAVPLRLRFERQLDWLGLGARPPRAVPKLPPKAVLEEADDVQSGMLAGYGDATHACLLLIAFDDAAAGAALLKALEQRVATAEQAREKTPNASPGDVVSEHPGDGPFYNIAFTYEGLRRLRMTEDELAAWLPPEFREGMEARCGLLGDVRANHPRRWRLPRSNWALPKGAEPVDVQLSAVHAVVQIRAKVDPTSGTSDDPADDHYALRDAILDVLPPDDHALRGVRVLSVQPMRRQRKDNQVVEHFGFVDGGAQPVFDAPNPKGRYSPQVHLGEVLLGYDNEADTAPHPHPDEQARHRFLRNGSFMVVRKLQQDVPRLDAAVQAAAKRTGIDPEVVLAKMMGRWRSGGSLINHPGAPSNLPPDNAFDFDDDPDGRVCPLHAHVRRVNPRSTGLARGEPPGGRRPRLLRRGMAYGPPAPAPGKTDGLDRGLMFIAYNASLSEQFEVVQRWITGGNSSGGFSGHSDPFLGVPEPGEQRHYRFEHVVGGKATACSIELDRGPEHFEEPEPFVRLQWGAYLFVPSLTTLQWLRQRALSPSKAAPNWSADAGQRRIDALERVLVEQGDTAARAAWKAALEDPQAQEQLQGASLWAALRRGGGARRTPYGVLVARRALIDEVLGDDRRFSVCGYAERMRASDFDIYLGLDHGPRYERLSRLVNQAITGITRADAFDLAAGGTEAALRKFIGVERAVAAQARWPRWELNLDAKEVIDEVQQRLCQHWLGLPDRAGALQPGSWRWDWQEGEPPIYPTHFTPPSRYFFQPCPADAVRRYGERYARALTAALQAFIAPHRKHGTVPTAPHGVPAVLAKPILDALRDEDDATVARTFAGVLMGFLPTLDGNLRLVLNEWLRLGTLWSLRAAWSADPSPISPAKAQRLLEPALQRAMQFRPSPELIWRTAQRDGDRLGDVELKRGDVVVLSLVSATHEALENGRDDVTAVFGLGDPKRPPTHACPGYDAAMGAMLGVLAGFVDVRETMRPSPAPLAFTLEGPMR